MAFLEIDRGLRVDDTDSLVLIRESRGYRISNRSGPSLLARMIFWCGVLITGRPVLEIDCENRVLRRIRRSVFGHVLQSRAARFEEIVRLEVEMTSALVDVMLGRAHWDCAVLKLCLGGKRIELIGGEISEIETLAARLRRDTGAR